MHTLVLLGELDRVSAATLETAIEQLCDMQVTQITLDLSKLEYIDETGVAVIAFRFGWCRARGSEITIVPGAETVQRVFELAGMCERLPFRMPEIGVASVADAAGASEHTQPALPDEQAAKARTDCEVPAVRRARSITLLRFAPRRARARRARLAGGGAQL